MSMYRDLIAMSVQPSEGQPDRPVPQLLAEARAARRRVASTDGSNRAVEADVARQLDYDVALVRLCQAAGVPIDLGAFAQPALERQRLEHALVEKGVDLAFEW